jgi:hypothetical protein
MLYIHIYTWLHLPKSIPKNKRLHMFILQDFFSFSKISLLDVNLFFTWFIFHFACQKTARIYWGDSRKLSQNLWRIISQLASTIISSVKARVFFLTGRKLFLYYLLISSIRDETKFWKNREICLAQVSNPSYSYFACFMFHVSCTIRLSRAVSLEVQTFHCSSSWEFNIIIIILRINNHFNTWHMIRLFLAEGEKTPIHVETLEK